jgi:hypothetical protein
MKDQTVADELSRFEKITLVEDGKFCFGAENSAPWLVVLGRGLGESSANMMMPVICNAHCVWKTIRQQRWLDQPYNVVAYLAHSLSEATRAQALLDERDYCRNRRLSSQREASLLAS